MLFNVANDLSKASGFTLTRNLGKYLGVPIHHSKFENDTYRYILDKMKNQLSTWKINNLSLVGRIMLSHAVLNSLPIYNMQFSLLQMSMCNAVDNMCCDFVLG